MSILGPTQSRISPSVLVFSGIDRMSPSILQHTKINERAPPPPLPSGDGADVEAVAWINSHPHRRINASPPPLSWAYS